MIVDAIFTTLLEPLFTKAFDSGDADPVNPCL
jgi:hypothetical protein